MMLICAWPSAGPTGGAGVALPASICNLTDVCTFFGAICRLPKSFSSEQLLLLTLLIVIILRRLVFRRRTCVSSVWHRHSCLVLENLLCCHFLYLPELQLHRCRAAKDRDHYFQRLAV